MRQEHLFEEKKPNIFVRFFKGIGNFLFKRREPLAKNNLLKKKQEEEKKQPRRKIVKV